jgi:hypothetical protein
VPLFFATGLVVGTTVALLAGPPLLPTIVGITIAGTFLGWLRTGWHARRRRQRRSGGATPESGASPSDRKLAFLAKHGREVIDGAIPGGLPPDLALVFIALLEEDGTPVHGLEVWRAERDGYSMDASSIWYAEKRCPRPYDDVRAGLRRARPTPEDLVLIQFGSAMQ